VNRKSRYYRETIPTLGTIDIYTEKLKAEGKVGQQILQVEVLICELNAMALCCSFDTHNVFGFYFCFNLIYYEFPPFGLT
jgi:hypothetical protein